MNSDCVHCGVDGNAPHKATRGLFMRQAHRLAAVATQLRQGYGSALFLVACAAFLFASGDAQAVMRGQGAGAIAHHVVKLVGHNLLCSATVIGHQRLLTANHCVEGSGPFFVVAGGKRIAVTGHTSAGQTTLLTLASPLPSYYVPISTGDASGESTYTIAGYGTAHEAERMHSAGLREAKLVADSKFNALVDPKRHGAISASACMGDSGGPVAKFDGKRYVLVGIVERVSNYAGIGACGFLTHFSAVSGTNNVASAAAGDARQVSEPRATRRVAGKRHRYWAAR
jgi:hypothetical protein